MVMVMAMATTRAIACRAATPADALCLGVLSAQVFLDTYATAGIRAELAREVLAKHSPAVFERVLADPASRVVLAECAGHLVGFVTVAVDRPGPLPGTGPVEIARLYVQRPFLRAGVGRLLAAHAEQIAAEHGAGSVWLTAWAGNARAIAFYRAVGYNDIGATTYVIEGRGYENRVFVKPVARRAA